MGSSFHLTSIRNGTVKNLVEFLVEEKATGLLSISFAKHVPDANIFVANTIVGAQFGALRGQDVFDLLICQERAIEKIQFQTQRIREESYSDCPINGLELGSISLGIDSCEARSIIYGLMHIQFPESKPISLFQVIHDFDNFQNYLQSIPTNERQVDAPLEKCKLLHLALSSGLVVYQPPLQRLGPVVKWVSKLRTVLCEREVKGLNDYLQSLLPHDQATHISIERLYAFIGDVESIMGADRLDTFKRELQNIESDSEDDESEERN